MSNQLTPTQIVTELFQTSKSEREKFVAGIIETIENGQVAPLKIHLQIKAMEDIIEQLKANTTYRNALLAEAELHGKKFEYMNAEIAIREVGTKYDYTTSQDEYLIELMEQKNGIDKNIKERQKFLQNVPESGIVDPLHGNMLYRPVKTSTTSVIVTLK
jgi:hypothetical protein